MENWQPIEGFEGRYEVSDLGRIRSLKNDLMLHPYIRGKYHCVSLRKPGVRHVRSIHQTVLQAFVGPRPDGKVAAHLDGQIDNNQLSNLAWVTPEENERHKLAHGTHKRGARSEQAKFSDTQVAIIREAGELGLAIDKIAILTGVAASTIFRIVRDRRYVD